MPDQTPLDTTARESRCASTRFKTGNPGRPFGTKNRSVMLENALKLVEKGRAKLDLPCTCSLKYKQADGLPMPACKTIDQHFAQLAMLDPQVLIAFQKKRIPDLQHQTGDASPTTINILLGHRKALIVQPEPTPA